MTARRTIDDAQRRARLAVRHRLAPSARSDDATPRTDPVTLSAEEGQAIGLTQYLVDEGNGLDKGLELAHRIAGNAPFTNFAVMHLLPRIARSDPAAGFATEALAAAIAQGDEEAKARLKAFLEKRGPKVARS